MDTDISCGGRTRRMLASTAICAALLALALLPAAAQGAGSQTPSACTRDATGPQPGWRIVDGSVVAPSGARLSGGMEAIGALGLHLQADGAFARTMFEDSCGEPYQFGYRLEGSTLHFPGGGMHELPEEGEAGAEAILRETYGLIGERDDLIRTRW